MYAQEFQDLLNYIDQHPEYKKELRLRLLDEELIALPEKFAELVTAFHAFAAAVERRLTKLEEDVSTLKEDVRVLKQDMTEVKEDVRVLKQDMTEVKEDVRVLKQDMTEVKEDVRVLKQDMTEVKEDVRVLKQDMTEVKEDVRVLKQDMTEVKEDVRVLKQDMTEVKEDVTSLQAGQRSLENKVAQLIGDSTETKVRRNILNIARDHLNMVKGIIMHAQGRNAEQAFTRLIDQAETDQIISEDESEDLSATDLIIRGRRRGDTTPVYAVFEISRTIHLNDIQRAHSRAETLTKATGYETIPAVIGAAIDPRQQRQAEESGVTVIIPLLFQPDQHQD